MDSNYNWSVSATSTNTANVSCDVIRDIVSAEQGVNSKRNVNCQVSHQTTGGARRLQDNTYTYSATLAASRESNVLTSSLVTLSAEKQAVVYAAMKDTLGSTFTASGYTPSTYTATQQTVGWSKQPSVADTSSSSVTIELTSDNLHGEIACVVLNK